MIQSEFPPENDVSTAPDTFARSIVAARKGCESDRAHLIEEFRDYLMGLAGGWIGENLQGQLSASDLVQSAIIDANAAFGQCRAESRDQFRAWLRRILLHDVLSRGRHVRRQKRDARRNIPLEDHSPVAPDETPSRLAMQAEDHDRLEQAMKFLPEDARSVIELRHREQLTFGEIGLRLNRSEAAARMLWQRSINRLATQLKRLATS